MANNVGLIKRPALGENVSLGHLYSAYNDSFLARNLCGFGNSVPREYIVSSGDPSQIQWRMTETDDVSEKVNQYGLSSELAASVLSDMVPTKGAASYLTRTKPSYRVHEASAICTITMRNERLNFDHPDLINSLPEELAETGNATHIVSGVQFGLTTVITARTKVSGVGSVKAIGVVLGSLNPQNSYGSRPSPSSEEAKKLAAMLEFDINSDRIELKATGLSYETVSAAVRSLPDEVKKVNRGQGYKIVYELTTLAEVAGLLKLDVRSEPLISVNKDQLDRLASLFGNFSNTTQQLNDYVTDVLGHKVCVPSSEVAHADKLVKDMKGFLQVLKPTLSRALISMRKGSTSASELGKLLSSAESDWSTKYNMNNPSSVMKQYTDKMAFYDILNLSQFSYRADDYDGLKIDIVENIANDYGDKKVYILYFNAQTTSSSLWTDTRDQVLQLIAAKGSSHEVVLVDCDMGGKRMLSNPRIELRQGREVLTYDVVKDIHYLADKPLLHCARTTDIEKATRTELIPPLVLKPVKIPCAGPQCRSSSALEWVCPDCKDTVCFVDFNSYMYCSCGKYHYSHAEFKCKSATHGASYTTPSDRDKYLSDLNGLRPYEEYNVLLLGDTGIGKSTFINMFLSFLNFETLDEACAYPGPMRCAVPGGFNTELKDERGNKIRDITVSFGNKSSQEQVSSGGQSATQEPSAYSFVVNGKLIRLIDTPGISDTRGSENINIVVKFLQPFNKIGTVLFFLQPNNPHLTPSLDLCLTEFLPRLQKNSTQNLLFGFPRARGTNFQLGDIRTPLLNLLEDRTTGITQLDERNNFFFDGDCFRHLAVFKQERVITPDRWECAKCWEASRDNIRRFVRTIAELPK